MCGFFGSDQESDLAIDNCHSEDAAKPRVLFPDHIDGSFQEFESATDKRQGLHLRRQFLAAIFEEEGGKDFGQKQGRQDEEACSRKGAKATKDGCGRFSKEIHDGQFEQR